MGISLAKSGGRRKWGAFFLPDCSFSSMNTDERIALLNRFLRQLCRTAAESLDSIDMLKLGSPQSKRLPVYWNLSVRQLRFLRRSNALSRFRMSSRRKRLNRSFQVKTKNVSPSRMLLKCCRAQLNLRGAGMPSLRRLWTPFRNDAHADVVRQGGADYLELGTRASRAWFLDENGTLRTNQLTLGAVGERSRQRRAIKHDHC